MTGIGGVNIFSMWNKQMQTKKNTEIFAQHTPLESAQATKVNTYANDTMSATRLNEQKKRQRKEYCYLF